MEPARTTGKVILSDIVKKGDHMVANYGRGENLHYSYATYVLYLYLILQNIINYFIDN